MSGSNRTEGGRLLRRFRVAAKRTIPFVLLYLIVRYVARDWTHLKAVLVEMSAGWTLVSVLFFMAGVTLIAWNWVSVLHLLGARCGVFAGFRSFYYSMLVKYIPGRIWGAAGRIMLSRQAGVPEGTSALGIILESLLLMCSAAAVGMCLIGSFSGLPAESRIMLLLSPLLIVLLHPWIIHSCIRFLASRFPDYVIEISKVPPFQAIAALFFRYCLVWILQGIGLWAALKSLVDLPESSILLSIGGNTMAWLAGFIVVLTPAGLGVRELMLTRITAGSIGVGSAAMVALISRLAVVFCELFGAAIIAGLSVKHSSRTGRNVFPDDGKESATEPPDDSKA